MHAGCRCSMKERRSFNAKPEILIMLPGDLTSTSSKSTHLLQGMGTIASQLKSFYRKVQTFYRKVQTFYRKFCISTGNFL